MIKKPHNIQSSSMRPCTTVALWMAICSGLIPTSTPNLSTTTKLCEEIFRSSAYSFSPVLMPQEPKHGAFNFFLCFMCRSLVRSNDLILNKISENRNRQVIVKVVISWNIFIQLHLNKSCQTDTVGFHKPTSFKRGWDNHKLRLTLHLLKNHIQNTEFNSLITKKTHQNFRSYIQ